MPCRGWWRTQGTKVDSIVERNVAHPSCGCLASNGLASLLGRERVKVLGCDLVLMTGNGDDHWHRPRRELMQNDRETKLPVRTPRLPRKRGLRPLVRPLSVASDALVETMDLPFACVVLCVHTHRHIHSSGKPMISQLYLTLLFCSCF